MYQITGLKQKIHIPKQDVSLLDETSRTVEFWSEIATSLRCKKACSRCRFNLRDIEACKTKRHYEDNNLYNSKFIGVLLNGDELKLSFFYKLIMEIFVFPLFFRISINGFEGAIQVGVFREMVASVRSGKEFLDKVGILKCNNFFDNPTLFDEIVKIVSKQCEPVLNAYNLLTGKLHYQVPNLSGGLKF